MINDYRNTLYCSKLQDISVKKEKLNVRIRKSSPNTKIIYNRVKEGSNVYKEAFMGIYNYKCGYCGNSIKNISRTLFEVDHYICESSYESKEIAGEMDNLVLACYDCNRSKSSFLITDEYKSILNPDLEHIKNVFIRDDSYYITISDNYKDDEFVFQFYDKLKLAYQSRRLDFLLMNIHGLCEKLENDSQNNQLSTILRKLQQKRNLTSFKLTEDQVLA